MSNQSSQSEVTQYETCPVCKGSKLNPYCQNSKDNTCKCCMGHGQITKSNLETMRAIQVELREKLKKRGICA